MFSPVLHCRSVSTGEGNLSYLCVDSFTYNQTHCLVSLLICFKIVVSSISSGMYSLSTRLPVSILYLYFLYSRYVDIYYCTITYNDSLNWLPYLNSSGILEQNKKIFSKFPQSSLFNLYLLSILQPNLNSIIFRMFLLILAWQVAYSFIVSCCQ